MSPQSQEAKNVTDEYKMITSNMLLTTGPTTELLQPKEIKAVTPKEAMIKSNANINPPILTKVPIWGHFETIYNYWLFR